MRIDTAQQWTLGQLRALEGADDTVIEFHKTTKTKQQRECWCGCGGTTKSRFVPGHDSRFHGLAKKAARGETDWPTSFVHAEAEADFRKWHDAEKPKHEARQAEKAAMEAQKTVSSLVAFSMTHAPDTDQQTQEKPKETHEEAQPTAAPLDHDSEEFNELLAEVTTAS